MDQILLTLTWFGIILASIILTSKLEDRLSNFNISKLPKIILGVIALLFPIYMNDMMHIWTFCTLCIMLIYASNKLSSIKLLLAKKIIFDEEEHKIKEICYFLVIIPIIFLLDNDRKGYFYSMALLPIIISDCFSLLIPAKDQDKHSPFNILSSCKEQLEWCKERVSLFFFMMFSLFLVISFILIKSHFEELILISIIISLLMTIVKAGYWRDTENIFVPLASYFIISQFYNHMNSHELIFNILIVASLMTVAYLYRNKVRLSTNGLIATLLSGMIIWFLGGALWVLPNVIMFVAHPKIVPLPKELQRNYDETAILSLLSNAFLWLVEEQHILFINHYYCYLLGVVAHFTMILSYRYQERANNLLVPIGKPTDVKNVSFNQFMRLSKWASISFMLIMPLLFYKEGYSPKLMTLSAIGFICVMIGGIFFNLLHKKYGEEKRWVLQFMIATLTGTLGAIPSFFLK